VPEYEIVIATGGSRGLEVIEKEYEIGIADPCCPVKYVITQQALAEGWDCPSAYVLASMAELHSSTAVEQVLGRILRQPGARARSAEVLNQSYAFVVSRDFGATANALRDRLVDGGLRAARSRRVRGGAEGGSGAPGSLDPSGQSRGDIRERGAARSPEPARHPETRPRQAHMGQAGRNADDHPGAYGR